MSVIAVFLVQIVKHSAAMDQKHVLMVVCHLVATQPKTENLPAGVIKSLCKRKNVGSTLALLQSKNARVGPFLKALTSKLSQSLGNDAHENLILALVQELDLGEKFAISISFFPLKMSISHLYSCLSTKFFSLLLSVEQPAMDIDWGLRGSANTVRISTNNASLKAISLN